MSIVERKGPLQNGDKETGKPFIDEKGWARKGCRNNLTMKTYSDR